MIHRGGTETWYYSGKSSTNPVAWVGTKMYPTTGLDRPAIRDYRQLYTEHWVLYLIGK